MNIGLQNLNTNKFIEYSSSRAVIINEGSESKLSTNFNNNIFGCGLIYPPTNKRNKFPYIFFTQNGKQIGKATLLKNNFDTYETFVWLQCCSVEANFGSDLETKPFKYDILKHLVIEGFY
uniref:Uncharacterized protein n=1 Tax=Meloidogyne enterolobii TaxID=390850 RepID=A0A6V7V9R3_MELEN|nr:unnamed protein product [Meloidogyne enterolobii]